MARVGIVGLNEQDEFLTPQNGQSPVDADQVTSNDNALRVNFNNHDASKIIHWQSGSLADRPLICGVGEIYLAIDTLNLYVAEAIDTWTEIKYTRSIAGTTGAHLIDLDADELSSGTVPGSRFPNPLPRVSGALLTDLTADNLTGTLPDATFPATLPAVSGALLTNLESLNATQLTTGTVPSARIAGAYTGITEVGTLIAGSIPPSLIPPGTFPNTGKYAFPASTTGYASIKLTPGVDPSSPVEGDIWFTATELKAHIDGVTMVLAETGGGIIGSGTANYHSRFSASNVLEDSFIHEDADQLIFGSGASPTDRWKVDSFGHLVTVTDAAYDIGTLTGPFRPRNVRLSGEITAATQPRVMVYTSGGVTVNHGARVPFANEIFDVGGFHDNATNNTRLTVPSTGTYKIILSTNGVATSGTSQIELWKNGSDLYTAQAQAQLVVISNELSYEVIAELVAGDFIEVNHFNSLSDTMGVGRCQLTMYKML